jgi:hypothetical protein
MVSTVADVVPIVAPSANHGATLGCFCARGEQTVKIAPKWVNRAAPQKRRKVYCGKTQLVVAFSHRWIIFAAVRAGAGAAGLRNPKALTERIGYERDFAIGEGRRF